MIGDHITILVSSHYKLKLTMSQGVLDCVTDKDVVVMSNKIKTTVGVRTYLPYKERMIDGVLLELVPVFQLYLLGLPLH